MLIRRAAALLAATLLFSLNALATEPAWVMSAPEAYARAEAGTVTLIDIRRPDEWRQTGVAPKARRINMEHPDGVIAFLRQVAQAVGGDANAPIALICRTGNRTTHLQKIMAEVGFKNVYNVKEGMIGSAAGPGWIARGLPIEACTNC